MRSRYKSILYIGAALAALAACIIGMKRVKYPKTRPTVPMTVAKSGNLPPEMSENTLADIRGMLEKQEYHISYDPQKKMLQSPNRKHNLRTYYQPGKVTVQTRVDTLGQGFRLELVNEGIFADGKPLHTPQQGAEASHHDNKVQISHDAFTEEFINNEEGVRQNFIVESAPAGTRQLQVKMAAHGLEVAQGEGNELRFYSKNKNGETRNELVYSDLKCWDAHKKPLTANLAFVDDRIQISVDVVNAAYPVTIDPIIANGTPQNANKVIEVNQSNMWLGFSVSSAGDVNGDGYSDIIVGAPKYDLTKTDEGAAIVFPGTGSGLSLNGKILACGQQGAQMGYSVASAGDFNGDGFSDVLVGIPFHSTNPTDSVGQARLYFGSAGGITPQSPYVSYSSANPDANTGVCVATAGDVDGDGFSDVLIGAHQDSDGQSKEGLVRVSYGGSQNNLSTDFVTLQCDQAGAMFGFSVASAGDVDGDGFSDVIVGARLYDVQNSADLMLDAGKVFIYHGGANGVSSVGATYSVVGSQPSSRMGHKVSCAGDVDGDGYSDVLVSEYMWDGDVIQNNEGRVFLFTGSSGGLQPTKTFEGTQKDQRLGTAVACAGDVNGDGYADIMLGAQYYDNGQNNEGAVFIHHGGPNGVSDTPASILESNQGEGWFGTAVASAGDVNGDGYSDILVGCYTFDNGQNDEGHVFLYHGSAEGVGTNGAYTLPGTDGGSQMGYSVASAGDVNSDGFDDVIVGAPEYDYNGVTGGIAVVYHGSLNGLDVNSKLVLSKNQAGSYFGESVAGAGDVNGDGYGDVVIGASDYDNNQSDEGVAFIYYGSNSGITLANTTLLENNIAYSSFGISVSRAGDINRDGYADIVIGDDNYGTAGQTYEGAIFIYYGSAAGPSNQATIESNTSFVKLGGSVSSAGDVNGDGYSDIIAGAAYYGGKGAAYIFHGSAQGLGSTPKIIQSNQDNALFGLSVSGAGDINGDGYSDVVVGSPRYDKGEQDEGAAFVYYGTNNGISEVNPGILEQNLANENFGFCVKTAGDVNGDGYSDIIASAGDFNGPNSATIKGKAFVYHGSPNGIKPTASFTTEGNHDGANLGYAVSGAGDVNGDGYSDIIVGAPHANVGLATDNGKATIYYGNNGKGLRNNVRLLNSDLVTPISYSQFSQPNFIAGLFAKSFVGRNKGKLVWETAGPGQSFSKAGSAPNINITTSTAFTSSAAWADVNFTSLLGGLVTKTGIATKVRVRVRYSPVLAITGQVYGPWRYVQAQLAGYNNAPVPEDAMAETIQRKAEPEASGDAVKLFPNPVSDRLSVHAGNPADIRSVRLYNAAGKLLYQSPRYEQDIDVSKLPAGVHILMIDRKNGTSASHRVLIRR